jgi:phage FluMu gp28-like protein
MNPQGVPLSDKEGNPITQLSREWIEYQYETSNRASFAQEFEARFVDESMGYFTRDDIIANIEDYPMEFKNDGESIYSMGVDFAKYHDSYVAVVVKKTTDNIMRVVYTMEAKNRDYSETVPLTVRIAKRFQCQYVFCDSTGVGEPNTEVIRNELRGISAVEAVNMSSLQKQVDMYANVQRMFGEGILKIPASNRELITQLSMVMRNLTPSGKVKIEAAEGQNDDFPDALALACMVSVGFTKPPKVMVTSVPSIMGGKIDRDELEAMKRGKRSPYQQVVVFDERGRIIGTRPRRRR